MTSKLRITSLLLTPNHRGSCEAQTCPESDQTRPGCLSLAPNQPTDQNLGQRQASPRCPAFCWPQKPPVPRAPVGSYTAQHQGPRNRFQAILILSQSKPSKVIWDAHLALGAGRELPTLQSQTHGSYPVATAEKQPMTPWPPRPALPAPLDASLATSLTGQPTQLQENTHLARSSKPARDPQPQFARRPFSISTRLGSFLWQNRE